MGEACLCGKTLAGRDSVEFGIPIASAVLLLIDHQVGTMGWVKSIPFEEMKRNALMLAKAASILKLSVVLTSSMEEYAQGPLLSELEQILPAEFPSRVKRLGIVNAWTMKTSPPRSKLRAVKNSSLPVSPMTCTRSIRR
jgi:hypothetical protein